jgi:type IV pilus assembly protein PilQ
LTGANLPFSVTTEVTSNVLVKDGHTIIIGGLFRESSQTSRSQVPGLGNLPGLGYLFRSQQDVTSRQEIIILLTPHIIKDEAAYSAASEAEQREAEKLRVGVRRGMMPFGRERLAESCYESAVKELNKPDGKTSTALWYLDSATNLNPKFIEAIDLKEKLTGKVIRSVNNCTFRSFVREQVLNDRPPATQPAATQEALFEPFKVAPPSAAAATGNAPASQPASTAVVAPATAIVEPAPPGIPSTPTIDSILGALPKDEAVIPATQPSDKAEPPTPDLTQVPLDDLFK